MLNRSSKLLVTVLALVMTACSPGGGPRTESVKPDQHSQDKETPKSSGTANEQAEALLDQGEALLTPENFTKSQDKFHAALALSPENPRAKFWVAMDDFLVDAHGMFKRVHPYYKSIEGGEERYNKLTASYRATAGLPLTRFFFTGTEDIHTTAEFSELFDRLRLSSAVVRKTLAAIRDSEFTITIPEVFAANNGHDHSCPGLSFGPIKFQPGESLCSTALVGQVGLNTSDFDQLSSIFSGMQLYLELLTAYRINQDAFYSQIGKPIQTKREAKEFVTKLFNGADGTLVRPKPFIDLQDMGAQGFLAMRYQQDHQATECPRGELNPSNRKGYLFSNGNCIALTESPDYRERDLRSVEALADGRPVVAANGTSEVDYVEIANHPPANIKELFPIRFDSCANVTDVKTQKFPKIFHFLDKDRVFAEKYCQRAQP